MGLFNENHGASGPLSQSRSRSPKSDRLLARPFIAESGRTLPRRFQSLIRDADIINKHLVDKASSHLAVVESAALGGLLRLN